MVFRFSLLFGANKKKFPPLLVVIAGEIIVFARSLRLCSYEEKLFSRFMMLLARTGGLDGVSSQTSHVGRFAF